MTVADDTRQQRRGAAPADGSGPAAEAPRRRAPLVRVAGRDGAGGSRTSPRMRFDVLQLVAGVVGLALIVAGLVALARAGFDELGPFDPVVEVGGQAATPLYAGLWLLVGAIVLAAGTGAVAERRLRLTGVVFGVIGAVFVIEPDAFAAYLGVTADSGTMLLAIGTVLVAASFVPPLSIARPGVAPEER